MNDVKTIIFDYDGTIHHSLIIYEKAFKEAYQYLVKLGIAPVKHWHQDEIKKFLGQNPKEMWESFFLRLSDETIQKASSIIGLSMKEQIESGKAVLYDGAIELLSYLKQKGYKLIYLSNSKRYYMDVNKNAFKLGQYFDLMICSEDYNYLSKTEIIKKIRHEFIGEIVIIGDRIHDIEAGNKNNLYTIACDYGYGSSEELMTANIHIENINQLYDIL
ncbi:MAG: HAD family hydrolase [Acholeplasmataceae bacterium]|jgi:phosphoglycolate phosphatase|nr:HAD family hydrolase [Acholeplasmataceae bacterium]